MNLRNKITTFLLFVAVLQTGVVFLAGQLLIMPHFEMLQEREATRSIRQLKSAVRNHIENLDAFTLDWAAWSDTYDFVLSRDKDYIESNLIWESFKDNNLNVIAIYDIHGVVIWGDAFDLQTRAQLQISEIPVTEESRLLDPRLLAGADHPVSGVIQTSVGPFAVAAHPILTSQNEGPSRGVFIMARLIDEKFALQISDQIHLPVEIKSLAPSAKVAATSPTKDEPRFRVLSTGELEASVTYPSLGSRPALSLTAVLSREIYNAGGQLVRYSLALLLVTMLALLGAAWYAIRRTVTEPITALASKAERALPHGDPREFWTGVTSDEIARLSNQIAEMLRNLSEARERSAEHSFNIGMARMASGSLHNANNGFTSLLLRIDKTVESLETLKEGDRLNDLIVELAARDVSNERRQTIRRFAEDYAQSLSGARRDAVDALDGLSEHARDTTRMLAYHSEMMGQPMELRSIGWIDLVSRALEVIPDGTFDGMKVEVDNSVKDAGPILGFPPGIIQIIIEIIMNSIESGKQKNVNTISLKFYCPNYTINSFGYLCLDDNGLGLDGRNPYDLYSINYSTKTSRRSGFGLNWCANLMQDMGGEITLEDRVGGGGMTTSLQLKQAEIA